MFEIYGECFIRFSHYVVTNKCIFFEGVLHFMLFECKGENDLSNTYCLLTPSYSIEAEEYFCNI